LNVGQEKIQEKILVVDDIPVNIQLLDKQLTSAGFAVVTARNGEEALAQVETHKPDLVLLDVMMPKLDGFETCRILKSNDTTNYIPVIMVTALNEMEDKIKGAEAGADDFITKPFNKHELFVRVKSLLRIKRLHDQLKEKVNLLEMAQERLKELAITDGLTGIYNHRYFKQFLAKEIIRANRHNAKVSLAMLDIDNFKDYNDSHGHLAGDKILRQVAKLMVKNIRSIDVAARYGGEEFVVILPQTDAQAAKVVAEKLRLLIENSQFEKEETQPGSKITISIGIATFPENSKELEGLINSADQRLYVAKAQGRNKVVDEG
jgi:two-component system, cell cycle response regulator